MLKTQVYVGDLVDFKDLPIGAFFTVVLSNSEHTMRVKVDDKNYGVLCETGIHAISKWYGPGMCRRSMVDLNEHCTHYDISSAP